MARAMAFEAAQTPHEARRRERGPCKLLNVLRTGPKGWPPACDRAFDLGSGVAAYSLVTGKMLPTVRASRGVLRDQCTGVTWELTSRIASCSVPCSIWVKSEKSRDGPSSARGCFGNRESFRGDGYRTRLNMIGFADDPPGRGRK